MLSHCRADASSETVRVELDTVQLSTENWRQGVITESFNPVLRDEAADFRGLHDRSQATWVQSMRTPSQTTDAYSCSCQV